MKNVGISQNVASLLTLVNGSALISKPLSLQDGALYGKQTVVNQMKRGDDSS